MKSIWFLLLLLLSGFTSAYARNADSLLSAGLDRYQQGDFSAALELFHASERLALAAGDKPALVLVYRNLGNAYSQLGQVIPALQAYQKSVGIAEETGDLRAAARSIGNIGALYEEQKDFNNALEYILRAEQIAKETGDSALLADCANNKGIVYEQQQKYPEALAAYQQALRVYEGIGNIERIGLTLNNMGIVYKFLGDYNRSIAHYQRSLKMAELSNNKFIAAANLNNIGNVYALQRDYARAIAYNKRSLQIAQEIKALNIIIEAYNSLAEAHAEAGDYRQAYHFYREYSFARDSFINTERTEQIAELQTRYETEKKEKEIATLRQKEQLYQLHLARQQLVLERRNYQVAIISVALVLLALLGYLFYSRQRLKQKQLREKAVLDTEYRERLRIARDVHDDLGSGLSRISLMAELAGQKTNGVQASDRELQQIARISKGLVDNMRDLIWALDPEHASLDHLAARIREFCGDYLEENGIAARFDIPEDLPEIRVSRELLRNVFLTVKEAVHNAVKHAKAQSVHIRLHGAHGQLEISVADDGTGFEADKITEPGNGLRNMRQRIETLNGSHELVTTPGTGTVIRIRIPLPPPAVPQTSK
jgi:signal transduction histidine kinase